jgi:ATP-dependent Lon protease
MIVPLFVGREKSVRALEEVMQDDKQILLSSQMDPTVDDPPPMASSAPACWPMCCNC